MQALLRCVKLATNISYDTIPGPGLQSISVWLGETCNPFMPSGASLELPHKIQSSQASFQEEEAIQLSKQ